MSYTSSPLGKKSAYIDQYDPTLLFAIERNRKRAEIGINSQLPFYGYDLWNAYEISWLNNRGKPMVALAEWIVPADSTHLIESKSLKLYFNSFNQTIFSGEKAVIAAMRQDLSAAANAPVSIKLHSVESPGEFQTMSGVCIDDLDVLIDTYQPQPDFLVVDSKEQIVTETVYSHLLKSNCLVTNQPDWGSIQIEYRGFQINHAGLLQYLVSLRNHHEFHEQCVERIFMNILTRCQPQELSVYARYSRRGGLDINPYRSTNSSFVVQNPRLIRQ